MTKYIINDLKWSIIVFLYQKIFIKTWLNQKIKTLLYQKNALTKHQKSKFKKQKTSFNLTFRYKDDDRYQFNDYWCYISIGTRD